MTRDTAIAGETRSVSPARGFVCFCLGIFLPLLFSFLSPAHAQEKYTYAPAHCDFAVTLPEAPYSARPCAEPERCRPARIFTRVYGMKASVNIRLTCNRAESGMYERYDGATMEAVLLGMTRDENLENINTSFSVYEDAKIAALTGTGTSGRTPKIYAVQIWIGKNSVFTLEGELIGEQHDEADRLFSDIIASIRPASEGSAANAEEKQATDKETSEKEDGDKEDGNKAEK